MTAAMLLLLACICAENIPFMLALLMAAMVFRQRKTAPDAANIESGATGPERPT